MKRKKPLCCCCIVPISLVLLPLVVALWYVHHELSPVSDSPERVSIVIPSGAGAAEIASILKQNGLIHNKKTFLLYVRMRGALGNLRAGRYRLSPNMPLAQIVDHLTGKDGETDELSVTIPEGFTLRQIAERLGSQGIVKDPQEFLRVVQSARPLLSAPFPLPSIGLEGYLFPETYRFLPDSRPEEVAQAMLDEFTRRFYEPHKEEIARSRHSLHEIVTIASLIERETSVPEERTRIAGVIENRLKRGMRLQIDASVLYALEKHKSRVLYQDLKVDSPYNTYRQAGLPPGPIASPGLDCLKAALHPEQHDFLFYVAGPEGSHVFSRSEAEHLRAVARMRALRARPIPTSALRAGHG